MTLRPARSVRRSGRCSRPFPITGYLWLSVRRRLKPQVSVSAKGRQGDDEAWRIWQENQLDADAARHHRAAKHGESYLLVWPAEDKKPRGIFGRMFSKRSTEPVPRITVEHPSQMIVAREGWRPSPSCRRVQAVGGGHGRVCGNPVPAGRDPLLRRPSDGWKVRQPAAANKLGVVPVIPLVNEPQMPRYPRRHLPSFLMASTLTRMLALVVPIRWTSFRRSTRSTSSFAT